MALWIGANTGKEANLGPEKDFKWVQYKVKALGVWLLSNAETKPQQQYISINQFRQSKPFHTRQQTTRALKHETHVWVSEYNFFTKKDNVIC